ncbi:MAG: hypothetical protein JWP97_158 [Labilithrix sp.]|nr:hypothetical protein [Labilithrix sp.]
MSALRRRSGARGAAFTEFLAVIPAFIAVNVALLTLWGAYNAKRSSMSESRQGAWSAGIKGCQGGAPSGSATKTSPSPDSALQQLQGEVTQARQAAQASPSLLAPFENLVRQASGAKSTKAGRQGESPFGKMAPGEYSTEGVVLCNEVPKALNASDEKNVVDDAWKKYVGR